MTCCARCLQLGGLPRMVTFVAIATLLRSRAVCAMAPFSALPWRKISERSIAASWWHARAATAWPRCLSRDGVARPGTGDPRPHTSAVPTRSQCQGATLAVVAACRNCGACCLRSLPCDGGAQRCCSPRSFAGAMTEATAVRVERSTCTMNARTCSHRASAENSTLPNNQAAYTCFFL